VLTHSLKRSKKISIVFRVKADDPPCACQDN
jgi:hypothetical protein